MEQGKFVHKLQIINRQMVKDYYREDTQSGQSKDGQSILHSICSIVSRVFTKTYLNFSLMKSTV